MSEQEIYRDLADAGAVLDQYGLGDMTRGHISIRDPSNRSHFFMKPHGYGFGEITRDNVVICDLSGRKVSGTARRHSEVFIHSELYRARTDVNCVIHVHPPHVIALSAIGAKLRMISQSACEFAGGIGYFSDAIRLIRTPELGAGVAGALGSCKAVIIRNHGAAVVGTSTSEAVVLTLALEDACRIQLLAQGAGDIQDVFSEEQVQELFRELDQPRQFEVNFSFLVRKVRMRLGAVGRDTR